MGIADHEGQEKCPRKRVDWPVVWEPEVWVCESGSGISAWEGQGSCGHLMGKVYERQQNLAASAECP